MNKPKTELRPIADVHPYELNAKVHDDKQVEKIAQSIKKFGWRGNPIVINEQGVILAGHGRRLAALLLELKSVPVEVVVGLTEDEQRAYRLADNRVAISNLDTDILQRELESLDFDMAGIFDKKELDFMSADMGELNNDAFVHDLDAAVEAQDIETIEKIREADEKEVKIEKALGFKSIQGKDERLVAIFMAQLEDESGKVGAEAFIDFVRVFSGNDNKSSVTE